MSQRIKTNGSFYDKGLKPNLQPHSLGINFMRTSDITFSIQLDSNNIPDRMTWHASDNPDEAPPQEIRSLAIAIWDHANRGTMKIDLWTKEMEVPDMKRFIIDSIGGLGESLKTSTGDPFMHAEIVALCDRLTEHVKKEEAGN